jgi:hypothetical protein
MSEWHLSLMRCICIQIMFPVLNFLLHHHHHHHHHGSVSLSYIINCEMLFSLSFEVDVLTYKTSGSQVSGLMGLFIKQLYTVLKQHSVSKCLAKVVKSFSVVPNAIHVRL